MGEIIEHGDSGNPSSVRVGDGGTLVSAKVYQDIYHQVTGRTEQIRKRYSQNLLVEFSEIEQLHHKICQLCDVHNIIAKNETVSVFHHKERKEQFTSFERFRAYNANASSPSVNVVLKYNFSIVLAGLERPQEYVVTIRLTSRVAMLEQMASEAPPFMRGRFIGFFTGNTAEVTVEYADYVIARGFLEAFDEWVSGCKAEPDIAAVTFLQRWSHILPKAFRVLGAVLVGYFSLAAVPTFLAAADPQVWTRFIILFGVGFYLITTMLGTAGRMIEEAIDSFNVVSYLSLNKGDKKLIDDFSKRKRSVIGKFIFGCLVALVLGIASSKIASLI
ncbi:hypothetical protein [Alloalcanivorax xenomutans]|uniref:hypothetical protein n=1 Tax=Alloalcanivorax xenomutans TaxID=1094342 RepID=UPI0024E1F44A|nr:hypothetical protein [Alloalcanivorax xenomutans]